ncbi:MAG: hypothetical protein RR551_08210, partial [Mucinivorans sp.]
MKWYDYNIRIGVLGINEHINFENWLRGCPRRSDEELTELEAAQKYIEELKELFEKQIKDGKQPPTPETITCTQCGAQIPYPAGCVICPVCGAKHCGE